MLESLENPLMNLPVNRHDETFNRWIDEWFRDYLSAEPAPEPTALAEPVAAVMPESQAEVKTSREDYRLAFCEAEGLVFDKGLARRLPYGVGAAAVKLGIQRQTLSTDLKAALERRVNDGENPLLNAGEEAVLQDWWEKG